MSRLTTRVLLRAAVALAVSVPLAAPVAVSAAPRPARQLTVMTQNLYLGSDLSPAINPPPTTPPTPPVLGFLLGVAQVYGTTLFTNFPARAAAIADEVAAHHPDLLGLEEVSNWTTTGDGAGPSMDYLAILQDELSSRGLSYQVEAVSNNANIGPVPLLAPCSVPGTCSLTFQDRDVILVNTHTAGLAVSNPRHGTYVTQELLSTPVGTLSFSRGWATVDATFWGQRFRFALTHLETEDFPAVQQAQGQEFLAAVKTPGAVLAVGDFNSAADGSNTTTYAALTADYFRDAWAATNSSAGLSCCQNGTLTNAVSSLYERIDLVLTHALHPMSATLVGTSPFEGVPPLWPSDHAGLVATVRLH